MEVDVALYALLILLEFLNHNLINSINSFSILIILASNVPRLPAVVCGTLNVVLLRFGLMTMPLLNVIVPFAPDIALNTIGITVFVMADVPTGRPTLSLNTVPVNTPLITSPPGLPDISATFPPENAHVTIPVKLLFVTVPVHVNDVTLLFTNVRVKVPIFKVPETLFGTMLSTVFGSTVTLPHESLVNMAFICVPVVNDVNLPPIKFLTFNVSAPKTPPILSLNVVAIIKSS